MYSHYPLYCVKYTLIRVIFFVKSDIYRFHEKMNKLIKKKFLLNVSGQRNTFFGLAVRVTLFIGP